MFAVEVYPAVRQIGFSFSNSRLDAARVFELNRDSIALMCRSVTSKNLAITKFDRWFDVAGSLGVIGPAFW